MFRGEGDWQKNIHSGVSLKIGNSFIVDCCMARTVLFADQNKHGWSKHVLLVTLRD